MRELRRLGVELRLSTRVDAALVEQLSPDVVIVATGSRPRTDPVAGDTSVPVLDPHEAMLVPLAELPGDGVRLAGGTTRHRG